jgi:hypothetical protein
LPTGDDSAHLRARRCAAERRVSPPSPKCASRSASRGGKARRVFNGLGAQSASSGAAMDVLARACTPSGRRVHADMHQRPATDVPLTLACDVNAASVGRAEDPVCNIRRSCGHLHAVINYGSTGLPGYLEHLQQKRAVWRRLQTGPAGLRLSPGEAARVLPDPGYSVSSPSRGRWQRAARQVQTLLVAHSVYLVCPALRAHATFDVRSVAAMIEICSTRHHEDRIKDCRPFGVSSGPAPNLVGGNA